MRPGDGNRPVDHLQAFRQVFLLLTAPAGKPDYSGRGCCRDPAEECRGKSCSRRRPSRAPCGIRRVSPGAPGAFGIFFDGLGKPAFHQGPLLRGHGIHGQNGHGILGHHLRGTTTPRLLAQGQSFGGTPAFRQVPGQERRRWGFATRSACFLNNFSASRACPSSSITAAAKSSSRWADRRTSGAPPGPSLFDFGHGTLYL